MPIVTYVHPDGTETRLDVAAGRSVMQAAVSAGIDEIVGECGGQAMCATCHVFVDQAWIERVAELMPMQESEDVMLDETLPPRRSVSRLGCQLIMRDELDGLIVHLPVPAL